MQVTRRDAGVPQFQPSPPQQKPSFVRPDVRARCIPERQRFRGRSRANGFDFRLARWRNASQRFGVHQRISFQFTRAGPPAFCSGDKPGRDELNCDHQPRCRSNEVMRTPQSVAFRDKIPPHYCSNLGSSIFAVWGLVEANTRRWGVRVKSIVTGLHGQ